MEAWLALLGWSGCGGAGKGDGAERHMKVMKRSGLCMLVGFPQLLQFPLALEAVWWEKRLQKLKQMRMT